MPKDPEMKAWYEKAVASYNVLARKRIAEDPNEWGIWEDTLTVERSGKITLCNKDGKTIKTYYREIGPGRGNNNQAIAWARSLKYTVPNPPNGCLNVIVLICGFLLGIIPGIIWIFYMDKKQRGYQKRIDSLVDKWIDAGKPEPGVQTNSMNLQAIQSDNAITNQDVGSKVQRINELKEKGLIDDDEHARMRLQALNEFAEGK